MKNLDLSNAQNMDLGVISNFSYSNASGEHPPEFNLDSYNSVIANPNVTVDQLNNLITEANNFATEYQRQSTEHASNQDYENSAITDSWRDTAFRVRDELTQKRNSLVASLASVAPIPQRNLGEAIDVAPIFLSQAVSDNAVQIDIPPRKKAPLPSDSGKPSPPDYARPTGDDDIFVADKTSNDGKILGMPKAVAIGLGIAVVSIGGFLVYKKFIAKK